MTGQLLIEIPNDRAAEAKPKSPKANFAQRAHEARGRNGALAPPQRCATQEILEAALAVFAEKGFAAARMDDIAARAASPRARSISISRARKPFQGAGARNAGAAAARSPIWRRYIRDRLRRCSRRFCACSASSSRPATAVVLPKMVIAEAGNFPDLARIYREEIIERGIRAVRSVIGRGITRRISRHRRSRMRVRLCLRRCCLPRSGARPSRSSMQTLRL